MKPMHFRLGIVVAGLLLAAGPALAQRPEPGAGSDRSSGGGGGGGGAVASGGGGGGGSASVGGGSSGGGGGISSSSPSAVGFSSPSVSMGDRGGRAAAPEHRVNYSAGEGQRTRPSSGGSASSSNDGQRPAPRSATAGSGAAGGGDRAVTRGPAPNNSSGRRAGESTPTNNASGTREVPNWSRPRGDRPATDTAVTRVGPRPDRNGGNHTAGGYYDPFYYGGFGYGVGYGFYDRFYYGYPFYSPFGLGYGIPYGYFDPYYGDPYEYGGGYGAYSSSVYGGHDQGALKLKVKPRNAKVYVDGYYVGLVDEFDGAFQKLTLNGGRHKVEIRAEGYETAEFDVLITPEKTVTFAGDLKKVQ